MLLEDLPPGGVGKAELRGTTWNVRTPATSTLRARAAVRGRARGRAHALGPSRSEEADDDGRIDRDAVLAVLVVIVIARTAVVVPQQSAFVVERLGKYRDTLSAGFHILVPFVDVDPLPPLAQGDAIDIPEQVCITRDNVQVRVDGVLYLKVLEPRARLVRHRPTTSSRSSSSRRPRSAARSARSTSTAPSRSARTSTCQVVTELDKASEPWGVKVLRYEIKNITPPAGRARGDGEADARRAREARRRS